jgi:hypothetical protein
MKIINWYIKLWANMFKYAVIKITFWNSIFWFLLATSGMRVGCINTLIFSVHYLNLVDCHLYLDYFLGVGVINGLIRMGCFLMIPSMAFDYFLIFYKNRYLNYVKDKDCLQDDIKTKKRQGYRFAWYLLFIPSFSSALLILILDYIKSLL